MDLQKTLKYTFVVSGIGYLLVSLQANKNNLKGNPEIIKEKSKKIIASALPWLGVNPKYEPIVRTVANKYFDTYF